MDEQESRIRKTLEERGALKPCSQCGHTEFTLLNGCLAPFQLGPGQTRVNLNLFEVHRLFAFVCDNCAHTDFYDAKTLGLT